MGLLWLKQCELCLINNRERLLQVWMSRPFGLTKLCKQDDAHRLFSQIHTT